MFAFCNLEIGTMLERSKLKLMQRFLVWWFDLYYLVRNLEATLIPKACIRGGHWWLNLGLKIGGDNVQIDNSYQN